MINSSPASVISPAEGISAEIVVVGSGPGGAITAAMLAEAGRDVLLIEEGPFLSLDSCPPFSRLEMEQKYRSRGVTVALGPTKINYVEGCCVGGGSEINSGLYHRTPPEILQRWHDQFAVADLSEEDLIPHFEAIEKEVSVSDSPGPLTPPSQVLKDGAAKLGWKSLTVPRWVRYGNETAGEHTARGRKQSMTETFIPRALAAGARLLPESRVRSMRRTGGRWRLKIVSPDNRNFTVEANTVFVSGGAIQTPALLQRSGVTKNVGRSVGLLPTVKIVARFAKDINYRELGVAAEQIKEFAPVLSFGCSIGAPEHLALSLLHHNNWKEIVDTSWKHMAIFYAALSTQSSGRVRSLPLFKDP
ncbi:MAG: GMC family oxidoreductase N-terminal domain-containing protein, partial [Pirellulales bacterium]